MADFKALGTEVTVLNLQDVYVCVITVKEKYNACPAVPFCFTVVWLQGIAGVRGAEREC